LDDAISQDILKKFETICSLSKNIPQSIKEKNPSIDYRQIDNFDNILADKHLGINYEIMWDIIKNKLPELKQQIELLLKMKLFFTII
jgi:uncharacterized protein with HEPN domain